MCRSVPQIPVRSTRMSTSSSPAAGTGTSRSHRPGSALDEGLHGFSVSDRQRCFPASGRSAYHRPWSLDRSVVMKRISTVVTVAAALLLGGAGAAHAVDPPAEFGADWDDPRTAAPPVDKPPTRSCTVQIVDHEFVNFDNYVNTFTPPAGCAGPWTKVVLHLDGAVKGRQFDRLGWLTIGDVMVFKTSTPEPSPEGIRWSVEKDISGYAPLLRSPQTVTMFLGNVVNDTFTGVLDIQVYLTFYTADFAHPAASTATDVLPLAGQ